MARKITVINGPNLNLLGTRNPQVYGSDTLESILEQLRKDAAELGLEIDSMQSNCEGELIDAVQKAAKTSMGMIINAGGYSHTSVAIRDALETLTIPVIEVHLSNIFRREPFRHHSYVSEVAKGVICGLGKEGYRLALQALHRLDTK